MEATVYVDLFFMINFSMDFLCLYLTAKLLSHKLSLPLGLLAAAFGGAYGVLALFLPFGRGLSFAIDGIACAVICFIAFFRAREWKRLPLYILVYGAVSMTLGGFMTALFNLFNRSGLFEGIKKSDGDGISVWLFAVLALVSGGITLVGGKFFTRKMSAAEAELEITYEGKRVRLRGMTDSGNLLEDPISGSPCIVVNMRALSKILPDEILEKAKRGGLGSLGDVPIKHQRRLVLVPAATASGGGILLGVRADRVSILIKGREREARAVIVLSDISGVGEGIDALIPSRLMI